MNVDDAIASLIPRFSKYYEALLRSYLKELGVSLGNLEEEADRPIFYMGEESDINQAIDTICDDDLFRESSFSDSPCFPLPCFFMLMKHDHLDTWSAIHVKTQWVKLENARIFVINVLCLLYGRGNWWPNLFAVFTREKRLGLPYGWALRQAAVFGEDRSNESRNDPSGVEVIDRTNNLEDTGHYESRETLGDAVKYYGKKINQMCYLISHPSNYVIKETPILTSYENRRVEKGKRYPDAKRPRYIIVDHEVLVGRLKPKGTHESPVPHQRRGHWMRLAERCRHARTRGLDKVWVRPCDVGDTEFEYGGRRYQVLLDFQDKMKEGNLIT